jgi:uncharacterized protein YjbI with pentapeptide repeats
MAPPRHPEKLIRDLEAHQRWLESKETEGRRADLEGENLNGIRELRSVKLCRAVLNGASFTNSDLTDTNLQGAELRRANFADARLRRTNLREADLQNANLETANFLLTAQLAGADVAGAKLPKAIAEFEGLKTIAEATSNAQKLFVAMLSGCLYSWLTIGTTKDVALLTNSASSPLPIIGTALPIVGFYMVAPVVLLALYFYFHLNMQRLWEGLADLPAVFPDGRSLDKRADPWLLNGLVSAHFTRLKRQRPPLSSVQQWLSILLAWWVVPVTLFVFWGRFLPRHDWFGTNLHIGVLTLTTGFGWMSYRLMRATLRGAPHTPFKWTRPWKERRAFGRIVPILVSGVVAVAFYFISVGALEGLPRDRRDRDLSLERAAVGTYSLRNLVPLLLAKIGFRTYASLVEEDVSVKPPNWTGSEDQYRIVKGASLDGANIKYANATSAFLANAQLRGANFYNAELSDADLTNANLQSANLNGAFLDRANLRGADLSAPGVDKETSFSGTFLGRSNLSGANLYGADLRGVTGLTGANLSGADLRGADLRGLSFEWVVVTAARLSGANLSGADLRMANLANGDLTGTDLSNADLSNADLSQVRLHALPFVNLEHAILDRTNLKGLDLSQVKGLTRRQLQTAIIDDQTVLPADLPP